VIYGTLFVGDLVRVTDVYRPRGSTSGPKIISKMGKIYPKKRVHDPVTEVTQYIGVVTRVGIDTASVRRAVTGDGPEEWCLVKDSDYWTDEVVHFGMMERVDPETLVPYMDTTSATVRKGDLVELRCDEEWRTGVITKTLNVNYCMVLVDGQKVRCLKSRLLVISRGGREKKKKQTQRDDE
jgi:hypothetical protein